MAKNLAGVTVHAMNPVPPRGQVFYASLPGDGETCKELLIAALWDHCVAMESSPWKNRRSLDSSAFPIQVVSGLLGRPHLQLGEYRGPAISFSKGGGRTWAALSGDESDIGIDVAGADEFKGEYPLQRVFHPEELHHAVRLAGGAVEAAAAMLWSVKEAVVKALGCGFHLIDPRQITVHPPVSDCSWHSFPVGLSGKALERFPLAASPFLSVHSLPQGKIWVSIANFNRRPVVYG